MTTEAIFTGIIPAILIFFLVSLKNDIDAKPFFQLNIHNTKQDFRPHHRLRKIHSSVDLCIPFGKAPEAGLWHAQEWDILQPPKPFHSYHGFYL